jgi:hypothetical protein
VKTAGNTEDGTAAGCGLARIDVGAPAASSGDSPSGHHDSTHAIQGPRCGLPVARKITSQSLTHVRDIAAGRIVACRLSGEGGGLCDLMRAAPRTVRARSCSLTTEPVNASDSASLGDGQRLWLYRCKPCQNAVPWNVNRSRGATMQYLQSPSSAVPTRRAAISA